MKTSRRASCSCGDLRLDVTGDPYATVLCHCTACQRRTGSAFGVGVYFNAADVTISGATTQYDRQVENRVFRSFFCPRCGTSVYWRTDLHPQGIGIGLGCFTDPAAFRPDRSVWESRKLEWFDIDDIPGHIEGGRSASTR